MRKILVTGGAGYIGSHAVVELYNSGYRPIIVDNFSNSSIKNILFAFCRFYFEQIDTILVEI